MIVMIAYDQNFGFQKFEARPMPRSKDTRQNNFTLDSNELSHINFAKMLAENRKYQKKQKLLTSQFLLRCTSRQKSCHARTSVPSNSKQKLNSPIMRPGIGPIACSIHASLL